MYRKIKIFQDIYLYNYYENNIFISDYIVYKKNILGNFYFKKENNVSEYSCLNNYVQIGMKIEIDIDDKTFSICTIDENEEEIGRSLVYDIKTGKIYQNIISINNKEAILSISKDKIDDKEFENSKKYVTSSKITKSKNPKIIKFNGKEIKNPIIYEIMYRGYMFKLVGDENLYQNQEIKDLIVYLKSLEQYM